MDKGTELYLRYRPSIFKRMLGQNKAVKMLDGMIKNGRIPHALLLTGPSGTGKTTAARILARKLGCGDNDFTEINAAKLRGIDTIREIDQRVGLAPMFGKCRIWLVDECHKMTSEAQTAILKLLEDTPNHAYFMLCTTDPQKLLRTIHTRCTEVKFERLDEGALLAIVSHVLAEEKLDVSNKIVKRIIEVADGSARKALVLLHQILDLESEEDRLGAIHATDAIRKTTDKISKALMNPSTTWKEMAELLEHVTDDDVETLRYGLLGYATSALVKGWGIPGRAFQIIQCCRDDWFYCRKAGLVSACYEVIKSGQRKQ